MVAMIIDFDAAERIVVCRFGLEVFSIYVSKIDIVRLYRRIAMRSINHDDHDLYANRAHDKMR